MKRKIIQSVVALFLVLSGIVNANAQETIRETLNLSSFTAISAENVVKIMLKQGNTQQVIKEVSSGFENNIVVEVQNGTLQAYCKDLNFNKSNNVKNFICNIYVTIPSIERVELENASSLQIENKFTLTKPLVVSLENASVMKGSIEGGQINVSTENASKFEMEVVADEITLTAENASKITISGKSKTVRCTAENVSKIDAGKLNAENIIVESNGLSKVIAPTKVN